jgi:hypothetical protein
LEVELLRKHNLIPFLKVVYFDITEFYGNINYQ